jgi:integrase
VRDIIEVLLGTGMRTGEVLALRTGDLEDSAAGMIAHVTGTVVQPKGRGAIRQHRPKTDASIRRIAVPEFAATVLRRRLATLGRPDVRGTIFADRQGGPLSPYNVRRTFREFLDIAEPRRVRRVRQRRGPTTSLLFGPVSGAHFNPVVSAADWLLGRRAGTGLSGAAVAAYTVAQVIGAVAGAELANLMYQGAAR